MKKKLISWRWLKRVVLVALALATIPIARHIQSEIAGNQVIYAPTGWLFLVAFVGACIVLFELALEIGKPSPATAARLRLVTWTTLAMLFVAEGTLRYATHRWDTYMEINGFGYLSLYGGERSWFHTRPPNTHDHEVKPEFVFDRPINSLGIAEREFVASKAPGEYRIFALGDSFTEGVGTSYDTSWVKVMQARLIDHFHDPGITIWDGGVSGSDPYYEFMLLKGKLYAYHPDFVVVDINTSDVNEIVVRGGEERFRPDGTTAYKATPWWERLYGLNYLTRAVVHGILGYDFDFVKVKDMPELDRQSVRLIGDAVRAMNDYCRSHGMRLLVVSHPAQFEVEEGHYFTMWYDALMRQLETEPDLHFVDLLQYYQQHGLITKENAAQYYWHKDLHHNTDGYRIMGEAIATTVITMNLGPGPASGQAPAETSRNVTPALTKAVAEKHQVDDGQRPAQQIDRQ